MKFFTTTFLFLFFSIQSYTQKSVNQLNNDTKSRIKEYLFVSDKFKEYKKSELDFNITNEREDKHLNAKIVNVRQKIENLEVYNAISTFLITKNGVQMTANRFLKSTSNSQRNNSIQIDPQDAYSNAIHDLNASINSDLKFVDQESKEIKLYRASDGKIIRFQLMYLLINDEFINVWNFQVKDKKNNHWWDVCVDANNGKLCKKVDWVLKCTFPGENSPNKHDNQLKKNEFKSSNEDYFHAKRNGTPTYKVFPLPYESPLYTERKVITNPFGTTYSPNGWHDVSAQNGNEDKTTKGNNVYAYEDRDADDKPGYSPYCNDLHEFNFDFDTTKTPLENQDASITQLFYLNNMMHDISYAYGFDEESGNFQNSNFTKKGQENDAVFAESQDGSGTNNANFETPPDGQNPRMQMFIFTDDTPSNILKINAPINLKGEIESVLGSFGPQSFTPILNKEVVLFNDAVNPDPNDACEQPINGQFMSDKIVLIKRGICKFAEKVKLAQDNGAIAVIIVNNVEGPLFSMGGSDDPAFDASISIPSILISLSDGTNLINGIVNDKIFASFDLSKVSQDRDSDFDNAIVMHEYTHGISIRLTGGPANSSCLDNAEQMGEGWSDYVALMLSLRKYDFIKDYRTLGLYSIKQDTTGDGFRPAPYSTNFNVNGYTYDDVKDSIRIGEEHGIGFIWASILWDMTARLVEKHGFDSDLVKGKGGNNIALDLVINALKLQPCSPGFVDGRDAILLADEQMYKGENKHIIWCAFAKRGVGFSADQGSSDNRFDQKAAFDFPPDLSLNITSCGPYKWFMNNTTYNESGVYEFKPSGICSNSIKLNLTILDPLDNTVTVDTGGVLKSNLSSGNYQWLDCKNGYNFIDSATSQSYKAIVNGDYAVRIEANSCIDTSACYSIKSLKINDDRKLSSIKIYPNPMNNELQIQMNSSSQNFQLNICDLTGNKVFSSNLTTSPNFQLFPSLENGTYEVEIIDGKGTVFREKLIVIRE